MFSVYLLAFMVLFFPRFLLNYSFASEVGRVQKTPIQYLMELLKLYLNLRAHSILYSIILDENQTFFFVALIAWWSKCSESVEFQFNGNFIEMNSSKLQLKISLKTFSPQSPYGCIWVYYNNLYIFSNQWIISNWMKPPSFNI